MFENDDEFGNENILYKSQPNLILSVRKAFLFIIILWFIFTYSGSFTRYIQELSFSSDKILSNIFQTIPINTIISLIILFLNIFLIIWIIWILISWFKTEYIITDIRLIQKRGIFSLKEDYVLYNHIQDIRLSQKLIERIFSAGTINIFSGYGGESLEFKYVNSPKKVQKIIFSQMKSDYISDRKVSHNYSNFNNNQRDYNEEEFDFSRNNQDINRENNFKQEPFKPKNEYNEKKRSNKKFNQDIENDDENLTVLERHSKRFKK
jgi:uncharacterized membrane protein YdbT with pleckstrin-like domain